MSDRHLEWSERPFTPAELLELLEELNMPIIEAQMRGDDEPDPIRESTHTQRRLSWSPKKGRQEDRPAAWWTLRWIYWRPFPLKATPPAPGGESLRAEARRRGVTVYRVRMDRAKRQGLPGQVGVRSIESYRRRLFFQLSEAPETLFHVDPSQVEIEQGRPDMPYPFLYIFEQSAPDDFDPETIVLDD